MYRLTKILKLVDSEVCSIFEKYSSFLRFSGIDKSGSLVNEKQFFLMTFFPLKVSGCRMSEKGGLVDLPANKSPPASSCFWGHVLLDTMFL
jgi:hypothetical protein